MHKELIIKAFNKAKELRKKCGEKKPSQISLAEDISDYIDRIKNFRLGERRFRDYYNEAEKLKSSNEDISIQQLKVIIGLCKYIGYDGYEDFVSKNISKKKKDDDGFLIVTNDSDENGKNNRKIMVFIQKNRIMLSISTIIIIALFIVVSISQQRWIWKRLIM